MISLIHAFLSRTTCLHVFLSKHLSSCLFLEIHGSEEVGSVEVGLGKVNGVE